MVFSRRFPSIPFPPRWLLSIAVLPMLLDVGLGVLNFHESTLVTRALTGGAFGLVVAYFIFPGFLSAFCSHLKDESLRFSLVETIRILPFRRNSGKTVLSPKKFPTGVPERDTFETVDSRASPFLGDSQGQRSRTG